PAVRRGAEAIKRNDHLLAVPSRRLYRRKVRRRRLVRYRRRQPRRKNSDFLHRRATAGAAFIPARIGTRRSVDGTMTGIVRLETSTATGIDFARQLADLTSAVLPSLATEWGRDPRAPKTSIPSPSSSASYITGSETRC